MGFSREILQFILHEDLTAFAGETVFTLRELHYHIWHRSINTAGLFRNKKIIDASGNRVGVSPIFLVAAMEAVGKMPQDSIAQVVEKAIEWDYIQPFESHNHETIIAWLCAQIHSLSGRWVDILSCDSSRWIEAIVKGYADPEPLKNLISGALVDERGGVGVSGYGMVEESGAQYAVKPQISPETLREIALELMFGSTVVVNLDDFNYVTLISTSDADVTARLNRDARLTMKSWLRSLTIYPFELEWMRGMMETFVETLPRESREWRMLKTVLSKQFSVQSFETVVERLQLRRQYNNHAIAAISARVAKMLNQ